MKEYFKTDQCKLRWQGFYIENVIFSSWSSFWQTMWLTLEKAKGITSYPLKDIFHIPPLSTVPWVRQYVFKRQAWKLKFLATLDINNHWLNRYRGVMVWFFAVSQAISKSVSQEWQTWLLCFPTTSCKLLRKERIAYSLTWFI